MSAAFTSKCIMARTSTGYRFIFFCDKCDKSYTSSVIDAASQKEALTIAGQEARYHFNRCQSCHAWVCDEHYNEDDMRCIDCAPKNK